MEERAQILKKLPLFSPLDWAAVRGAVGKAEVVAVKRDNIVVQEGEPGDAFYVIESGGLHPARFQRLEVPSGSKHESFHAQPCHKNCKSVTLL